MILHQPFSSRSSNLSQFFQDNSGGKPSKIDLWKSFSISRKALDQTRLYMFIYSIFALCLTLSQCKYYQSLFTIPYCCLLFQTLYFGTILLQTFKDHHPSLYKKLYNLPEVIYELVFSFSLFNFAYFWLPLLLNHIRWTNITRYDNIWMIASSVNLVVIWIEQLFNMMRFRLRDLCFVIGLMIINFSSSYFISIMTDRSPYLEVSLAMKIVLIIAPICHFIIGYKHYCYKKVEKTNKRKKLNEAIVNFKAVKERIKWRESDHACILIKLNDSWMNMFYLDIIYMSRIL